jgi:hypothetical protein
MLCADCLMAAVNDDYSPLDYSLNAEDAEARAETIREGLRALGPHLVPDYDSETHEGIADFMWSACDCCRTRLGGSRHRFAILGAA